ncbi:3-hydroxyacyl-CoA dehydrogenase NAD-binding domain-containing protein [Gammaproteobacteria bacterium]|nr:3-hydroxyacyl-CoA dehydrogenase NAD-binding domain-containing protein [Gammaproteobacteria bacterium]
MDKGNQQVQTVRYDNVFVERDDNNIAWLYFDQQDSSTNVLTAELFQNLDAAFTDLEKNVPKGLVFLSNKKSGFIAGADIKEFIKIETAEQVKEVIGRGQSMFNRLAAFSFPTVALIHGFCLGGGLELSLACDYRLACEDEKTRLGLPEVLLGIHPGFGGSVRLIELIGAINAMPLMLSGRSLDARRALKLGVVNEVVPRRHIKAAAINLINKKPAKNKRGWLANLINTSLLRPFVARKMRAQLAEKVNKVHYPAPFALLELWESKGGNNKAMMQGEVDSIAQLFMHPTAKYLIGVFLLQEKLKKLGGSNLEFSPQHVHVIGAGIMGGDIAAWCVLKGMRVTLQDREPKFIEPALGRANTLFSQRLKDPYERQAAFDRLIPDHKGYGVEKADVVIEAIIENLEAKVALYQSIEPRLKDGAIMATNTSSIPLQELAAHLQSPEKLIGLHFFNPVAKMQLVEVINAENTDQAEIEKGMRFTRLLDRLPLPTLSSPGFLVNRVLLPYLLEAVELLNDGVPAEFIDDVATEFGMPMGPILLADTVGLDICHSVSQILANSLNMSVPALLEEKVTAGKLGIKSGEGFYRYQKGKAQQAKVIGASPIARQEVQDRLVIRLLNECVAVLREGIVENMDLLDAGMIFGTGFAPFRGGPMHYLSSRGSEEILTTLKKLEEKYGDRFMPDAGWSDITAYTEKTLF